MRLGVIPTPAVAYLARKLNADAGVVISASHNPFEFNGIKFLNNEGYKLNDAIEDEIEAIIANDMEGVPAPVAGDIGRVEEMDSAAEESVKFAIGASTVRLSRNEEIALDTACGASSFTSPEAFNRLGAEVFTQHFHNDPDGININSGCGSTHMESLCEFVVKNGCDLGLAFDGDADRDARGRRERKSG